MYIYWENIDVLLALFSMYLTPNSVGNAELTLGGIDSSKFTGKHLFIERRPMNRLWADQLKGTPIYASVPPSSSGKPSVVWKAPSSGISVNGQTTDLLNTSRAIIFDSGTSNIIFSTNTTEVGNSQSYIVI